MSYTTEYKSMKFLSIGGLWGYAIMEIVDDNNTTKVRLAKCKLKSYFELDEEDYFRWIDVDVDVLYKKEVSQVQKINFKSRKEVMACFDELLEYF
ncbi:MAG: hypothetical protein JW776_16875 [Candidatus Lokiarchaeota archaeon]|nr:hypothetical protein [Candidatus Lokiarchaeota archaeon]